MTISRSIKTDLSTINIDITLTYDELSAAHAEFVTNFMKDTLKDDFGYDDSTAQDLAETAYEKYCEGDGLTEYECIEWAVDKYEKAEIERE